MVRDPVPVTAFAENFSPIPRIAPPPFGKLICGAVKAELSSAGRPSDARVEASGILFPPFALRLLYFLRLWCAGCFAGWCSTLDGLSLASDLGATTSCDTTNSGEN